MNALLVYPEFPPTYWSHSYSLKMVGKKCLLPPLGLITVAAMLPSHWRSKLVDLNIESLSDRELRRADVVLLTGMQVQHRSVHEVLRRCRRLGVPTIIGGPYVTSEPHLLDDADYLVLGEAEGAMRSFWEEFEAGRADRVTQCAPTPEVAGSPVPRFDLLKRGAYHHQSVQFSRGCPFTCDFCDIIVLFGRKPRTKSAEQVCAELDAIKATGFRGSVFFVDDNFIGNKKAVRAVLPEIRRWQERNGWPFLFYTEASLNLSEDPGLMTGMREAAFEAVFIGIESPSAEALEGCGKTQNLKGDIVSRVHRVLEHGLDVWGGFIVGFDNDGSDIFDRQIEVIEKAAIPFAMVGVLQALPNTPLESRLREGGRLRPLPMADQFGRTNFRTVLPESELINGYKRILETIYKPERYLGRVITMMRLKKQTPLLGGRVRPRHLVWVARALLTQGLLASYRRDYWRFLGEVWRWKPSRLGEAFFQAAAGHHFIEYTRRVVVPRLAEGASAMVAPPRQTPASAAAPTDW